MGTQARYALTHEIYYITGLDQGFLWENPSFSQNVNRIKDDNGETYFLLIEF